MAKIPVEKTPAEEEPTVEAPAATSTEQVAPVVQLVQPVRVVARSTAISGAAVGFILGLLVAGLCWIAASIPAHFEYDHFGQHCTIVVPQPMPYNVQGQSGDSYGQGQGMCGGPYPVQGAPGYGAPGTPGTSGGNFGSGTSGSGTTIIPGSPASSAPAPLTVPGMGN